MIDIGQQLTKLRHVEMQGQITQLSITVGVKIEVRWVISIEENKKNVIFRLCLRNILSGKPAEFCNLIRMYMHVNA